MGAVCLPSRHCANLPLSCWYGAGETCPVCAILTTSLDLSGRPTTSPYFCVRTCPSGNIGHSASKTLCTGLKKGIGSFLRVTVPYMVHPWLTRIQA